MSFGSMILAQRTCGPALRQAPRREFDAPRQQRCTVVSRCMSSSQESSNESESFASQLRKGFQPQKRKAEPPQAQTQQQGSGNGPMILGGDMSEETWRAMDKKLNKYPGYRTFTAIGSGGNEFKASMVQSVAEVVGPVHPECVSERPSSKGSYVSVRVGPVVVENPDQVIQIFANMKRDERLKWYM